MSATRTAKQVMRLAARRLDAHADRTDRTAAALEAPSGFGAEHDALRWREAKWLRRDAAIDRRHGAELDAVRERLL